ncbi:hypothetical protein [Sphingobium sp.]|uniref:hypothetical protein n=1 Tax=Sphingobium sp. TaxID=1912891 RepID=UPI003B3B60FE
MSAALADRVASVAFLLRAPRRFRLRRSGGGTTAGRTLGRLREGGADADEVVDMAEPVAGRVHHNTLPRREQQQPRARPCGLRMQAGGLRLKGCDPLFGLIPVPQRLP